MLWTYPFIDPNTCVSTYGLRSEGLELTRSNDLRFVSVLRFDPERLEPRVNRFLSEVAIGILKLCWRKKEAKYGIQPHVTPTLSSTTLFKNERLIDVIPREVTYARRSAGGKYHNESFPMTSSMRTYKPIMLATIALRTR